jgi:AcrR family transcriptional regulator
MLREYFQYLGRQQVCRPSSVSDGGVTVTEGALRVDGGSSAPRLPSSPGSRRPRGSLTEAHRKRLEEIKRVAASCFYRNGYAGTDIRSIANELDLHVSSLYNYIDGKEELLYLILRDGLTQIRDSFIRAVETSADPTERLRAALRSHILHHASRRHMAWTGHVEVHSLTGGYSEEIRGLRKDYEGRWISLLSQGIEVGIVVDRDPRLTMLTLLAIGQAMSRWFHPELDQRDTELRMTSEQLADEMTSIALNGVLVS